MTPAPNPYQTREIDPGESFGWKSLADAQWIVVRTVLVFAGVVAVILGAFLSLLSYLNS